VADEVTPDRESSRICAFSAGEKLPLESSDRSRAAASAWETDEVDTGFAVIGLLAVDEAVSEGVFFLPLIDSRMSDTYSVNVFSTGSLISETSGGRAGITPVPGLGASSETASAYWL
jgi:hypothetical protein